jgi:Family of unknown function (DUF5675)
MNLRLERLHGTKSFTRGILSIDGVVYCDTLEDEERKIKIYGKTAIPLGKYRVIINRSNRFKRMMPLLVNVPNFEGIRIHAGNTSEHTEGCILVGKWFSQGYITKSKDTFADLFKKLSYAFDKEQDIFIEII